jgi:hypothetical protein
MIRGGLFTRYFLEDGIRETEAYRALDPASVEAAASQLRALWQNLEGFKRPSEAETEETIILPTLDLLGWHRLPQQEPGRGRRDLADALLFLSAADVATARPLPSAERFRHGVVVVENEARDTLLDRASGKGEAPSNQILRYLKRADGIAGSTVRAGLLTSGRFWRLYWSATRARDQGYVEFDLPGLLHTPPAVPDGAPADHWLRTFLLLFRRDALAPMDAAQNTFLDLALAEGRRFEERITETLSRAVFDRVFPGLVEAMADADPKRAPDDAAWRSALKEDALTLLFRLLFVLYAEARTLLPIDHAGYLPYSLRGLQDDAAEATDANRMPSERARTWWPRITTLFAAIAGGDRALGLPAYNGGLFDDAAHPLLARLTLGDAALVPILDALSRVTVDGVARSINYRDLSVQQLGAIYEVLLARDVIAADGTARVAPDKAQRHAIGAFYTNDALVNLILAHAIDPLLDERREAFRDRAITLKHDKRALAARRAELDAHDLAAAFLRLKVCDPAMGSGHFLVALVDLLASEILAAMAEAAEVVDWTAYRSPIAAELEATRAHIRAEATKQGWPVREEQLDDKALIRRMVLKRVVYGVDKNKLAVDLAQLSLWLHSFTVGAPLSFLDHHLRCGDSLMGETVGRVRAELSASYGLSLPVGDVLGATAAMARIETLLDTDLAEVAESKSLFAEVEGRTANLRAFLDLYHARRWLPADGKAAKVGLESFFGASYGDPLAIAGGAAAKAPKPEDPALEAKLRQQRKVPQRDGYAAFATWLAAARDRMAALRPLHWHLAFPGLWREWAGDDPPGGFDAVIGNPPYVRQEAIKESKPALEGLYAAYDGTADLYVYFYERGLALLRPGGRLSYVVTNKWLKAGYAGKLRAYLGERTWVEGLFDFGHAKAMFPDADVMPCVLVARRPDPARTPPTATQVAVIARDDVDLARLTEQVREATFPLPRTHFLRRDWLLLPPEELALFDKLNFLGVPLHEYAGVAPQYGIKTGLNEAFVIDGATRARLIAEDPASETVIKPYLRGQDIDRWVSDWDDQWMIAIASSENVQWPWSDAASVPSAFRAFGKQFPGLHRHFGQFTERLESRQDQGRFSWELRSCSYYADFARPKIMYQVIQYRAQFSRDSGGLFGNDKTFFIANDDPWLLACLNSPLLWWRNWRELGHGKDEALMTLGYKMEVIPIAPPGPRAEAAAPFVDALCAVHTEAHAARRALLGWYRTEWGLEKIPDTLKDPFGLDDAAFAAALRKALPRSRRLTAAATSAITAEHAATVAPIATRLAEAARHERTLSDLVLDAYGLTPQERALMWRTTPPRMPIPPPPR